MLLPRICIIVLFGFVGLSSQAPATPDAELCNQLAEGHQSNCENFRSAIKTLKDYKEFFASYIKLNACIRAKKPSDKVLRADGACSQVGLPFASLLPLSRLIERFSRGERVCHMEFSSRIYELHNRLSHSEMDDESPVKAILRAFASVVMSRCQKSLADRLRVVERLVGKQDDGGKSVSEVALNKVIGMLNVKHKHLDELKLVGSEFAPILEDDLAAKDLQDLSVVRNPSGFEFKITPLMMSSLDIDKKLCLSVRKYKDNILGSLGLLASLGYQPAQNWQSSPSSEQARRINLWTIFSLICQSLNTVNRMSNLTVEGKHFTKILILNSRKADMSREDQFDTKFADYGFNEQLPDDPVPEDYLTGVKLFEPGLVSDKQVKLNRNRFQLIQGPSFKLATAIIGYIDITSRPNNRLGMVYELIGLERPKKENADEEEEEEEEEEDED